MHETSRNGWTLCCFRCVVERERRFVLNDDCPSYLLCNLCSTVHLPLSVVGFPICFHCLIELNTYFTLKRQPVRLAFYWLLAVYSTHLTTNYTTTYRFQCLTWVYPKYTFVSWRTRFWLFFTEIQIEREVPYFPDESKLYLNPPKSKLNILRETNLANNIIFLIVYLNCLNQFFYDIYAQLHDKPQTKARPELNRAENSRSGRFF